MKVVINNCFGGFSLSEKGIQLYAKLSGIKLYTESKNPLFNMHYTVPVKEYNKLHELDQKNGNYKLSNEVCFSDRDIKRDDPILVEVVKTLGAKANGRCAVLKIVEIPDGTDYIIEEYDGSEHVAEKHKTWN